MRPMLALLLAVSLVVPAVVPPAAHAAEDVKIALVAPLSGRWARQGQLKKMGADMAIEEINGQGGIKALGGAKIVLREADAGDSVEKAVSAAQRVLTREKISAGIGPPPEDFHLFLCLTPGAHRTKMAPTFPRKRLGAWRATRAGW